MFPAAIVGDSAGMLMMECGGKAISYMLMAVHACIVYYGHTFRGIKSSKRRESREASRTSRQSASIPPEIFGAQICKVSSTYREALCVREKSVFAVELWEAREHALAGARRRIEADIAAQLRKNDLNAKWTTVSLKDEAAVRNHLAMAVNGQSTK